jgi:hypothetical protein
MVGINLGPVDTVKQPSTYSKGAQVNAGDLDIWNIQVADPQNYQDAWDYLKLLMTPIQATQVVNDLKAVSMQNASAKDVLRSSGLVPLGIEDHIVKQNVLGLIKGDKMDPIMLVRGVFERGIRLVVAGGYHRVCTAYLLDVTSTVPCYIVDFDWGS